MQRESLRTMATDSEFEQIRNAAERKLLFVRDLMYDNNEYMHFLHLTIAEIASEMSVTLPSNHGAQSVALTAEIRVTSDLEAIKPCSDNNIEMIHLIVHPEAVDVVIRSVGLIISSNVYSIIVVGSRQNAKGLAISLPLIPVFSIENLEIARAIPNRLIAEPFQTIVDALNRDSVLLRFSEGFPT